MRSITRKISFTKNELTGIEMAGYRETMFFSTVDNQLCQWIEMDLKGVNRQRKLVSFEIRSKGKSARREVVVRSDDLTIRCYAPTVWPDPPDEEAELIITCGEKKAVGTITIGGHRPWTLYLLSDCCADDSWAYSDLEKHDRDDYRMTIAELMVNEDNCYNYPSVYQIDRFFRHATPSEKNVFEKAVKEGRFYISPVPNQLLCGIFTLSAYPLILEPYKHWYSKIDKDYTKQQGPAYHMEAPSWSNGLVNLFSCAGFRLFGKSLLRFLAPWMDILEELPTLTRLEVAPNRFVYFVLKCNTYSEGFDILAGAPRINQFLHTGIIPRYLQLKEEHPTSAIPIVGMYSDVSPDLPDFVPVKVKMVEEYNSQGWEYPRLVNATWKHFTDHVERELGDAGNPRRSGLRTVKGGTGSSWEVWMIAAQAEAARFRRAQRDVVSVRTLEAIVGESNQTVSEKINEAVMEVVELGDHAWNGTFLESKMLNLDIRRKRLEKIEGNIQTIRDSFLKGKPKEGIKHICIVNTLGWKRTCRVNLRREFTQEDSCIVDPETKEKFPLYADKDSNAFYTYIPNIPGFGFKKLDIQTGDCGLETMSTVGDGFTPSRFSEPPLALKRMKPLLILGDEELEAQGGWSIAGDGKWRIGPFTITSDSFFFLAVGDPTSEISPLMTDEGIELVLSIEGTPPDEPYELRWLFDLPWENCMWRGESGGGFVTLGPSDKGGDSLLGITGSIFSCGEGISAADPDGQTCIDFAFDHSGMCGIGGRSTQAGTGGYGERLGAETANLSVLKSLLTKGRLELYILGNKQNFREALIDQGGTRQWKIRCGIRERAGSFDDIALYRFACGFNYPAELVNPELLNRKGDAWLAIQNGKGVIPLDVCRDGESTQLDFYNTLKEKTSFVLTGEVTENRIVRRADMLGRIKDVCLNGEVEIDPMAYLKVIVS